MGIDYADGVLDYTIPMAAANTEYSLELPPEVKALEFRVRDGTAIRHSFTTGLVATPTGAYQTLPANGEYKKDRLYLNKHTLYVACASTSKVVEVRCWT